jgi:parallel beta-helix repeat protein
MMRCRRAAVWVGILMVLSLIFVVTEIAPSVRGNIVYVGGIGLGNYTTIQEGIDAASPGNTVFVYNGTYFENIVLDKTINLTGESRDSTIINGSEIGDVIRITEDWVNITGFTVTGGGADHNDAGIKLSNVQNCMIINNDIQHNDELGIYLYQSSNNEITGNNLSNNWYGIYLSSSTDNIITRNNVSDNIYGIHLEGSSDNNITHNNAYFGTIFGIDIFSSSNNNVTDNNVSGELWGISIATYSDNNLIINNSVSFCSEYGIMLYLCSNNYITDNTANDNRVGIYCDDSSMYISNNMLINNQVAGIYAKDSIAEIHNNTVIMLKNSTAALTEGIYLKSSNGTIQNNTIKYAKTRGISCGSESSPRIADNLITENHHGIATYDTSSPIIENNTITWNLHGIFLTSLDVKILSNDISFNDWRGVYMWEGSSHLIADNNISFNGDGGLYRGGIVAEGANVSSTIENNSIHNNSHVGILVPMGIISDNVITDNDVGIQDNGGFGPLTLENNLVRNNDIGVIIKSDEGTLLCNNTILNSTDIDISVKNKSFATTVNTTFDGNKVEMSTDRAKLIVKNFLHVYAIDSSGIPVNEGRVIVKDNSNTIYDESTSLDGMVRWMIITDRIYYQSNISIENITSVDISSTSHVFEKSPRNVNMSISHMETFIQDVSSPYVINTTPSNGAGNISINVDIIIQFNERMNNLSVEKAINITGGEISNFLWNTDGNQVIIKISGSLKYNTTYKVTIGTDAEDMAGNNLASAFIFEFITQTKENDIDEDDLPDDWEYENFGNLDQNESGDPDNDGLTNFQEFGNSTDPQDNDTDDDGMPDNWEIANDLDPTIYDSDFDADEDGFSNLEEYQADSDPNDPQITPGDLDGDGLPDTWEQTYFGNLSQGPDGDYDGDGHTNLEEYQARTDPTEAEKEREDGGPFFVQYWWALLLLLITAVIVVVLILIIGKKKKATKVETAPTIPLVGPQTAEHVQTPEQPHALHRQKHLDRHFLPCRRLHHLHQPNTRPYI